MTRSVLLLEGNAYAGEDLLDAAAELGLAVHVATHENLYERYSEALRAKITGEMVFTDFADLAVARRELVAFARAAGIDAVVTAWEFFAPLVTRIAADLGLPGHDPAYADASRNKAAMAAAFAAHDVPAPRTLVLDDSLPVLEQIERSGIGFPLVVKPVENAGSVGVSVVGSADGLGDAVALARHWTHEFPHGTPLDTAVLVQEYVGGEEFSIESVVARGTVHHLAITQKFTTADSTRAETGHTVPAQLDVDSRKVIRDAVEQAVVALGLRNGVAHTEVKLQSPGVVTVIEVGARPPGDNIMKLVAEATGVSEARAYLQVALGDAPDVTPARDRAAAIRFLRAPRAGTFHALHGLDEHPGVVDSAVYVTPGAELEEPRNNVQRLGHVIVSAPTPAEANDLADTVAARARVEMS